MRRIVRTMGLTPPRPKRPGVRHSPESASAWKPHVLPKTVEHPTEPSIYETGSLRAWLARTKVTCETKYRPTCLPEVNPAEPLWAWVKRRASRMTDRTKAELLQNLDAAMDVLKKSPAHVQPCLREKHRKYALVRLDCFAAHPHSGGERASD